MQKEFNDLIRTMATSKKKILDLEKKVLGTFIQLQSALGQLGAAASEILGYEVVADICNGNEIEFREVGDNGVEDAFSCIRIEEIIDKI